VKTPLIKALAGDNWQGLFYALFCVPICVPKVLKTYENLAHIAERYVRESVKEALLQQFKAIRETP
jgi:hypothetical protein